ncbi:MFS transporter [uncultured Duncaniella sp.]|uniref:MFS transporter n=1 Tax=uncultured Duncaniella sp. TaxID=2768039 RepID=UPI002622A27F|nr:MFS transporter [uncultured Duncaniella sp.]
MEKVIPAAHRLLSDKWWVRWIALILIASMMFFGYMFVDVMSPLQSLVQTQLGWSPEAFGYYAGAEYMLNVFGFLIVAGIILDKMGVRFTGVLSASVMFLGACIKLYAISPLFAGTGFDQWLSSWWVEMPGSAKLAALGFTVFGCGCEMAGITVSRAIAKWFKGKEMALAMGVEMAIARLGVYAVLSLSPRLVGWIGQNDPSVVPPVAFCTVLLLIGLISFSVFAIMDTRLDKQSGVSEESEEEEFKLSDVKNLLTSRLFWIIALLCVLYYSAIFPFQRFGTNMLQCNLHISETEAADLLRWFPIGALCLTPPLGYFLDKVGRGATMLILGSLLLIGCHLVFALWLPSNPSESLALITILVLGVSFSLVPAALWPSVPKVMDARYLGSAYSLIFWVQNIGLFAIPILFGKILESSNPGVTDPTRYDYTNPMLMFAFLGVLALLCAIWLKVLNSRNHYGLEDPNILADDEAVRLDGEA